MTTIATNGKTIAADSLVVDEYGLKNTATKLIKGLDWVAGVSGTVAQKIRFQRMTENLSVTNVLELGYPTFNIEKDNPEIIIVSGGSCWIHTEGLFFLSGRAFNAAGTGCKYALSAMLCGQSPIDAVTCAAFFDNFTGLPVDVLDVPLSSQ